MANETLKQQVETKMTDYLDELRQSGEVSYSAYSDLFDTTVDLLEEMYQLGKQEGLTEGNKGGKDAIYGKGKEEVDVSDDVLVLVEDLLDIKKP